MNTSVLHSDEPFPLRDEPPPQDLRFSAGALEPLYRVRGWMRLLGYVHVVWGGLLCLTLIGALVGWLWIWVGITLLKGADHLERGYPNADEQAIKECMVKIALLFSIAGALAAMMLFLAGLSIAIGILSSVYTLMNNL